MLFSHSHTQSSFYFCKSHKHVSNWPDHKIYTYYVFSYTCIIFTLPIILLYFSNYCYLSFNNEHFSQEVWAIFFLLTFFFSNRSWCDSQQVGGNTVTLSNHWTRKEPRNFLWGPINPSIPLWDLYLSQGQLLILLQSSSTSNLFIYKTLNWVLQRVMQSIFITTKVVRSKHHRINKMWG